VKKYFLAWVLVLVVPYTFAEEVTVSTVRVWVKVLDRSNHPVGGLTQQDFTVYEDDQGMPQTCFEEMTVPIVPQEAQAPVPAKKFVLFLDLFNTSQPEWLYIKPKLLDFLKNLSGSNREVMLAGVLANRKMGIFSQYTKDLSKIQQLIEQAQGNAFRDLTIQDNETEIRKILNSRERFNDEASRRSAQDVLRDAYQFAQNASRETSEVTQFSLKALEKFSDHLAVQNQGDHSVVLLISGGFSVDPGRRYFDIVDVAAQDMREQIESPELTIYHKGSTFDFRRALETSIGKMNRSNITLYTINTRGLITTDPDVRLEKVTRGLRDLQALNEYGDSLSQIAGETGGISFNKSQNFKLGFNNVMEDLRQQYLICYKAPEHESKGNYHKIKVVVNRANTEIRFRQGYWD